MATIRELLGKKDIKYIRNKRQFRLHFIELKRNAEGKVVEFHTHITPTKHRVEKNDFQSNIAKSDAEDWYEVTDEMLKSIVEEYKKPSPVGEQFGGPRKVETVDGKVVTPAE